MTDDTQRAIRNQTLAAELLQARHDLLKITAQCDEYTARRDKRVGAVAILEAKLDALTADDRKAIVEFQKRMTK